MLLLLSFPQVRSLYHRTLAISPPNGDSLLVRQKKDQSFESGAKAAFSSTVSRIFRRGPPNPANFYEDEPIESQQLHNPQPEKSGVAAGVLGRRYIEPIKSNLQNCGAGLNADMATPQLLSRKTNGVVGGQSSADMPKAARTKAPAQGEKVVIRRLPPAMTEEEFITILGDEWKVGRGKVDWFSYWPGKVSQHPSKPSQPSRAYLHVTRRDELAALVQHVQSATWEDAKETYNDPALVAPPTIEFAAYKKTPGEKKRVDGRQGTIDQDPEFMAFLEGLANPDAQKEAPEGDQGAEEIGKTEKTTTTPLVEYLKEKKAARAKEVAAAKSAKHARQDSQGTKGKATAVPSEEPKKRSRDGRAEKEKAVEKAAERPRESVKILTKKTAAAAEAAAEAAKAVAAQMKPTPSSGSQSGGQEPPPKSRRAGIAAAARILQRDLGLSPGNAHRKARQEAAKAESEAKVTTTKENTKPGPPPAPEPAPPPAPTEPLASSTPSKTQPSTSNRSRNRKRGAGEDGAKGKGEGGGGKVAETPAPTPAKAPITVLKKKDAQQASSPQPAAAPPPAGPSKTAPSSQAATVNPPSGPKSASQKQTGASKKANAPATPAPGATRAFIKHANHSQGVTDALLKESLQVFGAVTNVEMDRKKGFAYVDFAEPSGLVKAMAASPVLVAQATVQVLERKEMGKKGTGSGSGSAQGKNPPASASAPPPAPAAAKTQAAPPAEQNSAPATPASAGPATEKAGGEQGKRGGRRRGGRGRGDKDAKESPKDGGVKKGDGGGASTAPPATG
ncbi:Smg-4/UPF3 family-domain-containing protein [Chaetomium sp. MPI-CAGE-AT-0009]|nr:Smg-4/UPF3 family-domain-containing protein [Chaetomium sp. MPI-CAGE-AT-0009]